MMLFLKVPCQYMFNLERVVNHEIIIGMEHNYVNLILTRSCLLLKCEFNYVF